MDDNPPDQTPNDPTTPKRSNDAVCPAPATPTPHANSQERVAIANNATQSAALMPGTLLGEKGRYRIEQRLGRGGFCATYLAYDTQLDRDCVVKHLMIDAAWDAETQAAAKQGFQREVQSLSTLSVPGHDHIPEIYEFLHETNCLVMKYIKGANLHQVMQQQGGALPFATALDYMRAVCSALVYMHTGKQSPVLHRDIKPENILLGDDGRIWLIDFGLAKSLPLPDTAQSQLSRSAGTPGYTPIEQWRGAAEPRSDIYALAATLYRLITGFIPQPDPLGTIPAARQRNPAIPQEIEQLISKGMAEEPSSRPTAQSFLESLNLLLTRVVYARRLQAPDNTMIEDEQALAAWCEQHWYAAIGWLYSDLPKQVDMIWSNTPLANQLNRYVNGYLTDHHAGLDAALALIDPRGFGICEPQIMVSTREFNFGTLGSQPGQYHTLIVTNTGRRYLRAHVARPSWMLTPTPMVTLAPGEMSALRLQAERHQPAFRGRLKDTIQLRQDGTVLEEVRVRADCQSWLPALARTAMERPWILLLLTTVVILMLWEMARSPLLGG